MTSAAARDSLAADAWFVGTVPRPRARQRLYCLPYAGGAASVYRGWAELLPADIELWPIEPGSAAPRHPPALLVAVRAAVAHHGATAHSSADVHRRTQQDHPLLVAKYREPRRSLALA